MSRSIELTKTSYNYLERQLAQLQEQKLALFEDFLAAYAPGAPVDDRTEVTAFLDGYIHYVQELLAWSQVVDGESRQPPVTLIGCDIQVRDIDGDRTEYFRVVSPYEAKPAAGHISFLSPLGRSLLLKKPGEALEVRAPGGIFRYEVISVTFPD